MVLILKQRKGSERRGLASSLVMQASPGKGQIIQITKDDIHDNNVYTNKDEVFKARSSSMLRETFESVSKF